MKRFEITEHTADIGIRAFGRTRKELFENAAWGMFSLMTDLERVEPHSRIKVSVEADDPESLLVAWLNELLFLFESRGVLLSRFEIDELEEKRLAAVVFGERIDVERHQLEADIKAATYHMLRLSKSEGGWSAGIIFDV